MDIRQMEYFNVICETGSMSAAAQKLYVSQQALSKSLELLEKEVGMPLLVRSQKGITLTRQGEIFREEIQNVIRSNNRLHSRMDSVRKEFSQTLRIQFFSGMRLQVPKNYMEDFITRHPNVQFELNSYPDHLHSGETLNIDCDLFFSTKKISQIGMELLYEYQTPLKVIVHQKHELAGRSCVKLSDLQGYSIMTINSDIDIQHRIASILQRNGIYVQHRLGDGEIELMNWLIQTQNVVSFSASHADHIPANTVMIDIEDLEFPWRFYVYGHEDNLSDIAWEMLEEIRRACCGRSNVTFIQNINT